LKTDAARRKRKATPNQMSSAAGALYSATIEVRNVEQCELSEKALDMLPKIETHEHDPIEAVDRIVAGMPNAPTIEHAGSKAFYSSTTDRVIMPPRNLFISAEEYGATLLHEIGTVGSVLVARMS
jgi:antirestriction protein ArdC